MSATWYCETCDESHLLNCPKAIPEGPYLAANFKNPFNSGVYSPQHLANIANAAWKAGYAAAIAEKEKGK